MRIPLIAGNWKMNLRRAEAVQLAQTIATDGESTSKVEIALFPPFVYLEAVREALAAAPISVGGQDASPHTSGAYTGDISSQMLADIGCQYVILGHSERRQGLQESDELVHAKTVAALQAGLKPVVCVGETLQQRENGETTAVVRRQLDGSLAEITAEQLSRIVIAYEPVWAIGTGKVATPEQAQEVHADLRNAIETRYNSESAEGLRLLYGGSVKPDNAADLLSQPDIDGALVGGASLKAEDFLGIIRAT